MTTAIDPKVSYTYDVDHITPHIVADSPAYVVQTSKALIGHKAERLF